MDERRRHRRIHAAAERAKGAAVRAHLTANGLDLLLDEGARRPVRLEPADVEEKIGEQFAAVLGMAHLGMKLHAVKAALAILDGGDDFAAPAGGAKPGGQR